jgi:nitroimidazol reductase NimA-like FMN-containing flavoprotein (pyridoxamine 5'-phosphate oxidase superfamily)
VPRDYATRPYAEVHRRERAVDDDGWIAEFLHRAPMACLATVYDGQPFINTNLFVFDEPARAIYMHGAPVGRTRANVESQERVCFSVSEMGRFVPAPRAFNMGVEYAGVTVFGRARLLDDDAEKERALQMLVDKYFPHLRPDEDYGRSTTEERARTSVYRIEIDDWSGKRKVAEPDHPGAFVYPHSAA